MPIPVASRTAEHDLRRIRNGRDTSAQAGAAPPIFLFAGWYVAVLAPTLVFKYLYLAALSGEGSISRSLIATTGAQIPLWWVHIHDIAPADFLDAFCIVAGSWLLGRVVLRIPLMILACGSVLAVLAVGGLHVIAIREIMAPLTLDTVRITWDWFSQHPALIGQFLTPHRLAYVATGLAWAATPAVFAGICQILHARQPRTRHAVSIALALALAYSLVFGAGAAFGSSPAPIRRGFWTSIVSVLSSGATTAGRESVRSPADLLAAYARLAYPHGRADASSVVDLPAARRVPRHLVIVTLETAPLKYYPIADNPDLPAFHAMSTRALVSTNHYASAPMTDLAVYSVLTSTYPPPGAPVIRPGVKADGLAHVLSEHGYETSFIRSFDLQWNGPQFGQLLRDLGFTTIRDTFQLSAQSQGDWDAHRISVETRSFDAALKQVVGAARRQHKAFVFVETHLGHYPWLRPPHERSASAADKIAYTARTLDGMIGRFLDALAQNGLTNEVLIVVTGDHGLRFRTEFESLSAEMAYGDLVFNVPFVAFCPGLFPSQVRLSFSTSHVDIAPTVLDLLGIDREGRFLVGANMLDRELDDRIVFFPSASFTGLYPADAFGWKDRIYSWHRIIDRVTVRGAHAAESAALADRPDLPFSDAGVRRILQDARTVFDDTATYLRRRRPE